MEKLKIKVDGDERSIEFTEKRAKGLYLVSDSKAVINNCKTLTIDLGPKSHELEERRKVTKLGNVGILTTELLDTYFQYFIFQSVNENDFNDLLDLFPPESKDALKLAFTYAKL